MTATCTRPTITVNNIKEVNQCSSPAAPTIAFDIPSSSTRVTSSPLLGIICLKSLETSHPTTVGRHDAELLCHPPSPLANSIHTEDLLSENEETHPTPFSTCLLPNTISSTMVCLPPKIVHEFTIEQLTQLEFWWGMPYGSLNTDSLHNTLSCKLKAGLVRLLTRQ